MCRNIAHFVHNSIFTIPPMRPARDARGFTLLELITVVVVIAVCASLALPSLHASIVRMRGRAALDRVSSDLYYARMLAIREGTRTVVRFGRRDDDAGCHAPTYTLVVRSSPERVARETRLDLPAGTCIRMGTVDSIVFNSRGLQEGVGRKIRVVNGATADSLNLSLLGRTFRWY